MIAIIGGMGPEAGIDVCRELISLDWGKDEPYRRPVLLYSTPADFADRSSFLMGDSNQNPGYAIADAVRRLREIGATVVGVACNAAHASGIYEPIVSASEECHVELISIVDSVVARLVAQFPGKQVAALGVWGTYIARVYEEAFERAGIGYRRPSPPQAKRLHSLVWSPEYGIKFHSGNEPFHAELKREFLALVAQFARQGVQIMVLACTELPLLLNELEPESLPEGVLFLNANRLFVERLAEVYDALD